MHGITTLRIYARKPNCPSPIIFAKASQFHICSAKCPNSFINVTPLVGTSPWMWILREPAFPALSNTHLGQSCWSQTHKHHEGSSSRENTSRTPTLEPSETSYSLLSIILLFSNSSFWIFPFNRKIKWCIRKFPQCQFLKTKLRTKFFDQNNKWPLEICRGVLSFDQFCIRLRAEERKKEEDTGTC